ncbi:cation:proton antiporter [Agathobaculum hominis]|uniref:Cation:proton antiporter n=1 Tax=Agathobaculum hominis TaxID=2763014 RepID=A0ABR7GNW0_9FIRM|nr:cation:proton antiporter [Agathobaculum hominis]MBC5695973.1 cation:proton antiporter [Agathobaculum hominis]
MLTSLALVFLAGLAAAAVCSAIKLPRIIGMLLVGIVLGPHILNVLDDSILSISSELRQMALIIILLKAGLSLNLSDLRQVGRPAVLLSCLPATCELAGYILLAPYLLGVNRIEAAVMGAVLAAVSPAVVVPRMVFLMENRWGTDKSIPQMLLAGASCDDIYVIVLFTTFTGIAQGGNARAADFLNIPVSVLLGIAVGAAAGYALSRFFEAAFARNHMVRGSVKVIIVLSVSFLLVALETVLKGKIALSGLLAVTSMACMLARKTTGEVRARLSEKFGKLWIAAELILFVLVGAAVDIRYVSETGLAAVLMVFAALIFRAAGVVLCLAGTKLSRRERLFCVIAYLPKATVQAAIGSVPLAMGLPCGKIVLSVAVLAILITAPLGALGMDAAYRKLLKYEG